MNEASDAKLDDQNRWSVGEDKRNVNRLRQGGWDRNMRIWHVGSPWSQQSLPDFIKQIRTDMQHETHKQLDWVQSALVYIGYEAYDGTW